MSNTKTVTAIGRAWNCTPNKKCDTVTVLSMGLGVSLNATRKAPLVHFPLG